MRYRLIDPAATSVPITVDGRELAVPGDRSLLAGLLARADPPDFLCAIGQCQRCVVRVNGRERAACLIVPRPGDEVETPARWRRGEPPAPSALTIPPTGEPNVSR